MELKSYYERIQANLEHINYNERRGQPVSR